MINGSRFASAGLVRVWSITAAVFVVLAIAMACTARPARREAAQPAPQSGRKSLTLDHLVPARDSVGGIPTRFAWTPVEGADEYVIGVWTEVDVLVWRQDNLHEPSVAWPADLPLEPGTYFWAVAALRQEQSLADSGRSAFVVR